MQIPEVSLIIPCYNQAQYLEECLQSVFDQSFQNWECIIVNDGSPDNTEEIAIEWVKKDDRFKFLKKENGGLSSARNYGISNSCGEYILPLDADDYISENYIEECINLISVNSSIKVVYGKGELFGQLTGVWNLSEYSFEELKRTNMIFCTALYRKIDWEINQGYDENMKYGLEDWEFWINLLKRGGTVQKSNDCTFYYRIKDISMLTVLQESKKNYLCKYIFFKHKELYDFNPIYEHYELMDYKLNLDKCISFRDCINVMFLKIKRQLKLK
jgi:glycosyltransferase involved in cell wall biosynthesis